MMSRRLESGYSSARTSGSAVVIKAIIDRIGPSTKSAVGKDDESDRGVMEGVK